MQVFFYKFQKALTTICGKCFYIIAIFYFGPAKCITVSFRRAHKMPPAYAPPPVFRFSTHSAAPIVNDWP